MPPHLHQRLKLSSSQEKASNRSWKIIDERNSWSKQWTHRGRVGCLRKFPSLKAPHRKSWTKNVYNFKTVSFHVIRSTHTNRIKKWKKFLASWSFGKLRRLFEKGFENDFGNRKFSRPNRDIPSVDRLVTRRSLQAFKMAAVSNHVQNKNFFLFCSKNWSFL